MEKTKVHIIKGTSETLVTVHCPACKIGHPFRTAGPRDNWTWNGSRKAPTFQPSMLVFGTVPERRCHSFVTDGQIRFLGDCFHDMKNQTVDLPYLDEDGDPIDGEKLDDG